MTKDIKAIQEPTANEMLLMGIAALTKQAHEGNKQLRDKFPYLWEQGELKPLSEKTLKLAEQFEYCMKYYENN